MAHYLKKKTEINIKIDFFLSKKFQLQLCTWAYQCPFISEHSKDGKH